MPVSEQTYPRVALEAPEGRWELHCGKLVEKPAMTFEHNDAMNELGYRLRSQLDRRAFYVHGNASRAKRSAERSYTEILSTGGPVQPTSLPGVTIDLDALFA